jgi:hypothetical protein
MSTSQYVRSCLALRRIPESECEYCRPPTTHDDEPERFDENGYPIKKVVPPALQARLKLEGGNLHSSTGGGEVAVQEEHTVFRFLDLPPELRNRIYELVFYRPAQPVCVRDPLLRLSKDTDLDKMLRHCYSNVICAPCQLFQAVGITPLGLSQTSQQMHSETALVPYAVNTFSLHNLQYLEMFLVLIGHRGRKNLKSLVFQWRLPEEEAQALGISTKEQRVYSLLAECTSLEKVETLMGKERRPNKNSSIRLQ